MARDDYRKFNELLDLITDMCRPICGLTYTDIMKKLNCSRKTAERTVNFLNEKFHGYFYKTSDPVNSKIQRFRLESPDGLPPEYLNNDEMLALSAVIKSIKNTQIREPLKSLEYKLNKMLSVKKTVGEMNDLEGAILSRTSVIRPYPQIQMDDNIIKILQHAVLSGTKVILDYAFDDRIVKYTLCPLGFIYGNSNNYLVAYRNTTKDSVHKFIISNISNVKLTKEHFNASNFDIIHFAESSFGTYHSEHGPYNVIWHVSPMAADEAMRYIFHPTQKIIRNKDGSLIIKFKADGLLEMACYLFQWRGEITPIAPKELVATYKDFLTKAINSIK